MYMQAERHTCELINGGPRLDCVSLTALVGLYEEVRFALDSSLEEAGFEPSVPPGCGELISARN